MQEKKWFNYPSTDPYCWISIRSGESDIAMDTDTNTIFLQIASTSGVPNRQGSKCDVRADPCMRTLTVPPAPPAQNMTVYAVDATTGKEKWSYFIPGSSVRGGTIVSGGVVYVNSPTGFYYALDEATGKVLHKIFLGAAVVSQASIGKTEAGKTVLFLKTGGLGLAAFFVNPASSTAIPGALMAYGLPAVLPQPQVITKEVIKEVIKEVPKEVVREVVKEVPIVKEVVKEVPKEVIKEVPKEVIKEVPGKETTKTVTVETISPISYAAIGISVVILVIAGVLFTRRKKS